MAEQNTAVDPELAEDGNTAEVGTADLDTTTSASNGEQVEEQPELQDGTPESQKKKDDNSAATAAGVIEKVKKLLAEGKDIPKDQRWALDHINPPEKPSEEKGLSTEELDRWADEREAKTQFQSDKSLLETFPTELRNRLVNEANGLKADLGVPISKALARVIKSNKEAIEEEIGIVENRKTGAAIPVSTKPLSGRLKSEYTTLERGKIAKANPEKYNKIMEAAEKGEITLTP